MVQTRPPKLISANDARQRLRGVFRPATLSTREENNDIVDRILDNMPSGVVMRTLRQIIEMIECAEREAAKIPSGEPVPALMSPTEHDHYVRWSELKAVAEALRWAAQIPIEGPSIHILQDVDDVKPFDPMDN